MDRIVRVCLGVLLSALFGATSALAYDRTITITAAQQPFIYTANPFAFNFDDATTPPEPFGLLTWTVFGIGDVDGLGPDGGIFPSDDGSFEIVSFTVDGISITFGGLSEFGPFGSRTFSTTSTSGTGGLNFANGLSGFINFGVGVDDSQLGDFIGVRLVYAPIPEPETYALMLAGLGLLAVWTRKLTRRAGV